MYQQVNDVVDASKGTVSEIKVTLLVEDVDGEVNFTDVMLQGGTITTKWSGHPSEIKWTVDG